MHIPRAFCHPCEMEMLIDKTGAHLEVFNKLGSYYKITADMFRCPMCETIVALPARAAIAQHFQPIYGSIPTTGRVHLNG